MPENTLHEVDQIQRLSRCLAELPDVPATLPKRKLVALLASDIQTARHKGHTLKAIAQHLQSRGFDINYNTLRDALPRQRKTRSGPSEPRGRAADGARTRADGTRMNDDGARTRADGTRTRVVVPAKPPRRAPVAPERVTVPAGAASVPTGDGYFVPAPDSDDL